MLDVPHVWNGWTKNTLMQADEVVITATPELANLRNTKNLVDMLKKLRPNDGPPRLILNQAGVPKRPEISAADFAEPLGIAPMAVIPFDPQLFGNAANNGRMLGEMDAQNADRPDDQRDRACADRPRPRSRRRRRPVLATCSAG